MIADVSGHVSPFGEYAKVCEIALGRELNEDDDIENPAAIFLNKIFRVTVGIERRSAPTVVRLQRKTR